jgi:membrane protein required for beta-lactamase induction
MTQQRGELRQEMAGLREQMAQLESRLNWRIVTLLGVQIALVGILVTILFQVLR